RVQGQIAHLYEYQSMLGKMRKEFPPRDPTLHGGWRLTASPRPQGDPAGKKLAKASPELLERVVKDYPGTPWAVLARFQLLGPTSRRRPGAAGRAAPPPGRGGGRGCGPAPTGPGRHPGPGRTPSRRPDPPAPRSPPGSARGPIPATASAPPCPPPGPSCGTPR